jgi:hypothetical protein
MKAPIAEHPAMRHTLLRLQALTEAQRVIAYRAALALDVAAHHGDATVRAQAAQLGALLTPIVKAFITHHGFHSASAALQVWGGYGYVHDYGIEQTLRDARIAMVYEGTNEIQAIDLLQRKVLADGGAALKLSAGRTVTLKPTCARRCQTCATLPTPCRRNAKSRATPRPAVLHGHAADTGRALRVADDYLFGLSHTLLAWAFAASARAALQEPDADWAQGKTARMRYGMQWVLPAAASALATGVHARTGVAGGLRRAVLTLHGVQRSTACPGAGCCRRFRPGLESALAGGCSGVRRLPSCAS